MTSWNQAVVAITGGSAGLGLATAQAFAAVGAQTVLLARDSARLAAAAEKIQAAKPPLALSADITQDDAVAAAFSQIRAQFGRLDVLVNCAGKSARGPIAETTPAQFQELWELNFLSAVRCTRAALPLLLERKGSVVHIGSLASKSAARYLGAYPASKFPLAAYSQQLRLELGPQGLHVLLVCPGPIRREDAGQRYAEQSANLPPSASQPGGGVRLKGIDPALLARRIVRACELRESELVIPGYSRLLFAIAQLSPALGDWILRRMTKG